MSKVCRQCQKIFEIAPEDRKFYDEISPVFAGKKFAIPEPTLCPECRLQRRMSFRNERHLYHRKCDLTGKQIISMHSENKGIKVYDQEEWWGDKWDPLEYGRDFDFSRTFAEQFQELYTVVPHISLFTNNVENSYYTSYTLNMKNCYLVFGGAHDEDCMYCHFVSRSKDILDSSSLYSCELCYEGVSSEKCYECLFFTHCKNCTNSIMIEDCESCQNCLLCFGLRNKEYCVLNEFVGKEKFEQYKKELFPLTTQKIALLRQKLQNLQKDLPHRAAHIYMSENCSGDMVISSKNCHNAFDIIDCEDCRYIAFSPKSKSSYDSTFNSPDGVQFCYEVCSTVGTTQSMANFLSWYNESAYYSMECNNSQNLFGCVGVKSKKYCIFNKQYEKETYFELVAKIAAHMMTTGEWGEFFPQALSSFGYQETIAQEYFPLEKEEILNRKWRWVDATDEEGSYFGPVVKIPENIADVPESICEQILTCTSSGKNYKINPQELKFYQKMGLPIPRLCPDERHKNRITLRNPRQLYSRKCRNCQKTVETNYAPDRQEVIYCEECYLKTVY